jgi:hypothetical protein
MDNNRRNFIKKSILGMSGAALIPVALKAGSVQEMAQPTQSSRSFAGKTGIKTPAYQHGYKRSYNPGFRKPMMPGLSCFFPHLLR